MKLKKNIAISESGFIFNPANGDSFSTNLLGSEILHLMMQEKSADEIKKLLGIRYEVESKVIEKDFDDFMVQLRDNNFLEYDFGVNGTHA